MPSVDWNKRWGRQIVDHVATEESYCWGCQWGDPRKLEVLGAVVDRYIRPFVSPDLVVMEIGPGGGRWTEFLVGARELVLVELNPEFFPYLETRFADAPARLRFYVTKDAELDGIASDSIDFLFTFGVFVHIDPEDIVGYLGHIARVLTPGGRAVIQYADKTKKPAQENDSFSDMHAGRMQDYAVREGFLIEEHNTTLVSHSNIVVLRKALVHGEGAGEIVATGSTATAEGVFDQMVRCLGHDAAAPAWTPALTRLHRHSRLAKLQVIPDFFYAPVFSPADLPPATWDATFPACGHFDIAAQQAFLRETPSCASELSDYSFEPSADPCVFHWGNEQFSHADAPIYYAIVRRVRPRHIIEVGAGHSTKLALAAVGRNEGGRVTCVDPHPPAWLSAMGDRVEVVAQPIQEVPDALVLSLQSGDILFVDGSHICRTGSDVNHVFLRLLPRLSKGVLVHVHDICLPYEYPRSWSEDYLCYWNEQYVLAALLANSGKFEVLVAVHYLQRDCPDALRPFLPALPGVTAAGGSIWLRARE